MRGRLHCYSVIEEQVRRHHDENNDISRSEPHKERQGKEDSTYCKLKEPSFPQASPRKEPRSLTAVSLSDTEELHHLLANVLSVTAASLVSMGDDSRLSLP